MKLLRKMISLASVLGLLASLTAPVFAAEVWRMTSTLIWMRKLLRRSCGRKFWMPGVKLSTEISPGRRTAVVIL